MADTGDPEQPMPTSKFKSRADAERFTQWVIEQGARGYLNAPRVNALMGAVKQWSRLQERLEKDVFDRLVALCDRAHDEVKRLREIAAEREGTE